jgi:excisionase family DNA binding protein
MPIGPKYYKVHEVATMFRLSKMSVYRMCHSGEIKAIRLGRSFRIPAADLRVMWPELFENEGE